MTRKNHIVKINFPGGIVPSGDLLAIVQAALSAGLRTLRFGGRQQLLLEVYSDRLERLTSGLAAASLAFETDEDVYPNIVSSCVAEQVVQSSGWLKEGVYKDVLESFASMDYRPRISVNLIDQGQSLVPFDTGQLNFIASGIGNYWHLLLRISPQGRLHEWRSLVYSGNIPRLVRRLEACLLGPGTREEDQISEAALVERMYPAIMETEQWIEQAPLEKISFPDFALPYYEGFNRYRERLWLGIYRRDELFPLAFLTDMCTLCLQTKVAQLYVTPWKSIIIQGIGTGDRKGWDIILGRHGINVRHSLCELSWQVEDVSAEALSLKHYLVRQFDRDDVRTFGLCFAIRLETAANLFCLILIQKQRPGKRLSLKSPNRYDILYRKEFNTRSDEYVLFRKGLEKEHLGAYLKSLCKYFYECKAGEEMILHHVYRHKDPASLTGHRSGRHYGEVDPADESDRKDGAYQCIHCLTLYEPALGDPAAQVPAGTVFDALDDYACPVCGSDKSAFIPFEGFKIENNE